MCDQYTPEKELYKSLISLLMRSSAKLCVIPMQDYLGPVSYTHLVNENESETLEVICEDDRAGIRLFLYYTIFENYGIVLRHQKVENYGKQTVFLQNIQSMSLELPAEEYELMTLYGTHAKEANMQRFPCLLYTSCLMFCIPSSWVHHLMSRKRS